MAFKTFIANVILICFGNILKSIDFQYHREHLRTH